MSQDAAIVAEALDRLRDHLKAAVAAARLAELDLVYFALRVQLAYVETTIEESRRHLAPRSPEK